jgi:hypothetical protein
VLRDRLGRTRRCNARLRRPMHGDPEMETPAGRERGGRVDCSVTI